ncbi:hypothetical protein B1A55_04420 [Corynebacterium diphtheriae]|nr:hypothetical protein BUE67_04400 [Corynebacterium diphtheriae]OLO14332.1 hypothetical protein BUV99_07020 [Corynebacterium diphtheriae]OLO22284.1 hypothetical protein BVH76_06545 [Corynebacterium diphtheriae]OLO24136.1 hypothetical protein BVH78_04615 [Corynebacterium diphtheriae]OMO43723.1 hypothetical protein BVL41_08580 [Corynebacterium diphtheriae]
MSTRSSLSEEQREQLVGLCEQDLGFTAAARRIGVRRAPVRSLYHHRLLHGRLCLVEKLRAENAYLKKLRDLKNQRRG